MKTVIRRTVQVSIPVDIHVEYDSHAREASIVSASIPKGTTIRARSVHESFSRGDYKSLDQDTRRKILEEFSRSNYQYDKQKSDSFTRSIPCNPQEWRDVMSRVYKHLPITSAMESIANRLQVLIEPVVGPFFCAYFWPIEPTDILKDRESDFTKHLPSLNNPAMEFLEDNTVYIQWNY